jgi:hypothetical protein
MSTLYRKFNNLLIALVVTSLVYLVSLLRFQWEHSFFGIVAYAYTFLEKDCLDAQTTQTTTRKWLDHAADYDHPYRWGDGLYAIEINADGHITMMNGPLYNDQITMEALGGWLFPEDTEQTAEQITQTEADMQEQPMRHLIHEALWASN